MNAKQEQVQHVFGALKTNSVGYTGKYCFKSGDYRKLRVRFFENLFIMQNFVKIIFSCFFLLTFFKILTKPNLYHFCNTFDSCDVIKLGRWRIPHFYYVIVQWCKSGTDWASSWRSIKNWRDKMASELHRNFCLPHLLKQGAYLYIHNLTCIKILNILDIPTFINSDFCHFCVCPGTSQQ